MSKDKLQTMAVIIFAVTGLLLYASFLLEVNIIICWIIGLLLMCVLGVALLATS